MDEGPAIRVLIADDHPIVRRGLRSLINTESGLELVGEAENGAQAVELARRLKPDIILLDLVMPQMDGIEAIPLILEEAPEAHILVVTSFADDDKVFPAIKAGAIGYLLKESAPETIVQAIRDVYNGQSSLHPAIARKLIGEITQPSNLPPAQDPLTEREMTVLRMIARGLGNQQIANELTISEGTVRFHVSNILSKLHLANRIQAALYAIKEGYNE